MPVAQRNASVDDTSALEEEKGSEAQLSEQVQAFAALQ